MDGRMSLLTSPFVPEGMVDLMKKLSKKVIKERPPNIYEFAADFFEKMLIERDGSLDKGYGKFRSYTEYCKFMDKMDKKRLTQPTTKEKVTAINVSDSSDLPDEVPSSNIEIQGVAIQGVERKSKDSVKNVSINPKYKSQSEKVMKPMVSNVKNVKAKPRKLSSKKPSENLIVIKEETSVDDDDIGSNEESKLNRAAKVIQNAFRRYISKDNPRNENVAANSRQVSGLSENAAALIIQKAFKSMIQKLKVSTSNKDIFDEDSNKNIVAPVSGQENDIFRDKIPNNNDEPSEQILSEHLHDVAVNKQDLEFKENQLKDASDDTAITTDMESNQLAEKLDDVTAFDTVAQIETETDGNSIGGITPKESSDEVVRALGNTAASSINQDGIKHEGNREEIAANRSADQSTDQSADQVEGESNLNKIVEKVDDSLSELIPNQESETTLDHIATPEIESAEILTRDNRFNGIETSEDQVQNISKDVSTYVPDSQVEFELSHAAVVLNDMSQRPDLDFRHDQLSSDATDQTDEKSQPKQMENIACDTEPCSMDINEQKLIENVTNYSETSCLDTSKSESVELTAPLPSADELGSPHMEESLSELLNVDHEETEAENTLISLNNQASDENLIPSELEINQSNNVENTIDGLEEKKTELIGDVNETDKQPKSNDQLFLVENDGIYVNLDVLQDKLGKIAVDDGAGSDDEKSFKLNILEREEILVNQENMSRMEDEVVIGKENAVDNNNELPKLVAATEKFEEIDNLEKTMESESKDEEGNEEYELAETVVLGDVPLRQAADTDTKNQDSILATNKGEEPTSEVREEVVDLAVKSQKYITTSEIMKLEQSKVTKQNQSTEPTNEIREEVVKSQKSITISEVMKLEPSKDTKQNQSTQLINEVRKEGDDLAVKSQNSIITSEVMKSELSEDKTNNQSTENINEVRKEVDDLAVKSQNSITTSEVMKSELSKDTTKNQSTAELNEINSNITELHSMNTTTSIIQQDEENVVNDETANSTKSISEEIVGTGSDVAGFEVNETKHETIEDESTQKISTANENKDFDASVNKGSTAEFVSQLGNPPVDVKNQDDAKHVKDVILIGETEKEDQVDIPEKENEKIQIIENEIEIVKSDDFEETMNATNNFQSLDEESIRNNENEKIIKAATAIQKVFRGYIVRRTNIKTTYDKNQLELSAALIIQKYARGYLVRRYVNKTKKSNIISVTSNETKEDVANTESIPPLPAYPNRFLIPKDSFLERESFADDEDYARTCKELAATSIQKTYRGYRVRRSLKENEFSDNYEDNKFTSDDPVETVGDNQTENVEDGSLVSEDQMEKGTDGEEIVRKDQEKSLGGDQVESLDCDQVEILGCDQVESLVGDHSESFVGYQVQGLAADQAESLVVDQAESIVSDQVTSLEGNQVKSLGDDQVERLGSDQMESLVCKTECDEQVESVDDKKVKNFDNDKVESVCDSQVESAVDDRVETVESQAHQVISAVLNVAADVLPGSDSLQEGVTVLENKTLEEFSLKTQEESSTSQQCTVKRSVGSDSVLGQVIHDDIHVEGQMQQKFNHMTFQDNSINPIEEMSDSSEQPDTPCRKPAENIVKVAAESVESKFDDIKSFSYEQLSSDLSDTDENKQESFKESEVDETSRDERDDLSEVENFDLSSCGEDSLEAMYYSIRKNEIMLDRMQKQVAEQREPNGDEVESVESEALKMEFPERVTENLYDAMKQVFKSVESSSDNDGGSTTLDLGLDDSSSINDEKEIETSRHIKQSEEINFDHDEESESTIDNYIKGNEEVNTEDSQSSDANFIEMNADLSQQSDNSFNSSTRFIMKSQSVSEDMMNPIMFAMKRKQALLDQMHVRPYPLQENLSEDHDAFPEHLLSDIDIGNIQRKIFASSVSETDSDYIEPNITNRRLVRDDFNISTALDHLSTDSDSTIVSAATKIQAGARGFLTRRRLRRTSAGGTSISFEKRYSFGNAAIDKSLEDLIKRQEQINLDGAALKIQQQYRRYQARKKNLKKVSPIREQTLELSGGSSVEGNDEENIGITEITLAQKKSKASSRDEDNLVDYDTKAPQDIKLNIDEVDTVQPVKKTPVNQRRLTLQRGDAVQRNSRPDSPDLNLKEPNLINTGNQACGKCKDSETGEYTGSIISKKEKKVTPYINIQSLINRGIGPRQRSMPVQIDSELMRIIPKHLRKRVKSADIAKKKSHL